MGDKGMASSRFQNWRRLNWRRLQADGRGAAGIQASANPLIVCVDSPAQQARRLRGADLSAGVRADEAVREREHHELGTRFELQLAHDVGAVSVDRPDGDEELLADLLVRVAERQQMENVAL